MSDNIIQCVFCGETKLNKILKFTPETKNKCLKVLEYRRSKPVFRKSRTSYRNIVISADSINEGYHAKCYKLFTAIKTPSDQKNEDSSKEYGIAPEVSDISSCELHDPVTSETLVASTSTNGSGVSSHFEQVFDVFHDRFCADTPPSLAPPGAKCFICGKTLKIHRDREVPLSVNKFKTLALMKSVATEYNDKNMLEKISSFSNHSNIAYHKCCKDQYLRDITKKESTFLKRRKALDTAFTKLCEMLQEKIVKNNDCLFFDYVKKEYQQFLVEENKPDTVSSASFCTRHLERKIKATFPQRIKIFRVGKAKCLASYTASISPFEDLAKTGAKKQKGRSVVRECEKEIID